MKKGKYQSTNKRKCNISVILCLFLLLVFGIMLSLFWISAPIAQLPDGSNYTKPSDVAKNPDTIAIPGYEAINLKADVKQQNISLSNPAQNMCYFQITLLLEDGTILWQSNLIKPGQVSDPIVLSQELEKGTYPNACLKYDCYTMDGNMTALNGATTKLSLIAS